MIAAIIFYCVLFRQAAITLAHNYSSVISVYLQPRSLAHPQVGLTTFYQHSISYAQSLQSARFNTYRGKRAGKRKQRPIETITPSLKRHYNFNEGINFSNLRNIQRSDYHTGLHDYKDLSMKNGKRKIKCNNLNIVLTNARSVRNKATIYSYYILENDLDIIIITETWLNDQGDESVIHELVPAGYSYVSRNRKNREGGGIIIIYKETLQIKLSKNESYTSFESIEVTCKISKTNPQLLRIFGIYRPPPSVKNKLTVNQFLSEFQDFLIEKTLLPSQAIFAGDFNFHVDDVNNNFSNKFLGMIESFNLYQQVREITHEKVHILDLVIANNDSQTFKISNIRVE